MSDEVVCRMPEIAVAILDCRLYRCGLGVLDLAYALLGEHPAG